MPLTNYNYSRLRNISYKEIKQPIHATLDNEKTRETEEGFEETLISADC